MGYPVIMGSNTYNTIENELKGRDIIIFNRHKKPINILNNLSSDKCFMLEEEKLMLILHLI
ncbi:MAG: hypothetical protein CM1200mP1_11030 [Candidatus Neomarinimicrobiota bacterium]|nr:MAG: hypothetical protein CM1200mP1_11030 [Candidatus Neomarinimicrobiota bacterium]